MAKVIEKVEVKPDHSGFTANGLLKVVKESQAHNKSETVNGIHAGKSAKFTAPEKEVKKK